MAVKDRTGCPIIGPHKDDQWLLDEIDGCDAGYRHYCEDIDLAYRAMQAGWERWYVPEAVVTHDYAAVIDKRFLSRHTLWHARGMARFVRKHPERLLAL